MPKKLETSLDGWEKAGIREVMDRDFCRTSGDRVITTGMGHSTNKQIPSTYELIEALKQKFSQVRLVPLDGECPPKYVEIYVKR